MAISSQKLSLVFISLIVFIFPFSLSHRCPSHESDALLRFKAGFNQSHGSLNSWVNGTNCCAWEGISCDNHTNHVVSVELFNQQSFFHGDISESLCQLRFLKSLSIEPLITAPKIPSPLTGTKILSPCLGNLSHMESLVLYGNELSGMIPSFLCLLTRLSYLDLSENMLKGSIPACLGNLSSLINLDLTNNQLSGTNELSGIIPSFLCLLTRLTSLHLGGNMFNGSIPACLGNLSSLIVLDLSDNQLSGTIPSNLDNLYSLIELHLDENHFSGTIPCLGSLPHLYLLDLHGNKLGGSIPSCLANHSSLYYLDLSDNQLTGSIPPAFAQLSLLNSFFGVGNHFNETIFSTSLPSSLMGLSMSLNQSISETFFHNLTKLETLYLSDCVLNMSKSWIPSFQLYELQLVSSTIDDEIPPWISTQFSLEYLELVNTGLVGKIPSWLWETCSKLQSLNLSGNHLEGGLISNTSVWMQLKTLDVSRNELTGHIPSIWSPNMIILFLNDNLFTGNIPPSLGKLSHLWMLNLANNNFIGLIPLTLFKCYFLLILNLGNNSLEGSLPDEFSELTGLNSLVVHSNNLKGSLSPSIANCSALQVLDIGNNFFGGEIPTWLKNLSNLRVLVMKENNFTGSIPQELGQLINLQILLLSSNHISGSIPHAITSLQAMSMENQNGNVLSTIAHDVLYRDGLDMTLKGKDQHYTYILSTLTSIDLSNNELEGEFASDFGKLKGLRLLNLSRNNFRGTMPNSLGELSQLESLDLSRNHFSGRIPAELEFLDSLGFLNLSSNNLSGSIPQARHIGTFGESSYLENPNLWGCPLPKNCSWPQFSPPPPLILISEGKKIMKYSWYKIAVGLSYGAGFGGILSLILIKMNWRWKCFNKIDTILKFLFPWMEKWTV